MTCLSHLMSEADLTDAEVETQFDKEEGTLRHWRRRPGDVLFEDFFEVAEWLVERCGRPGLVYLLLDMVLTSSFTTICAGMIDPERLRSVLEEWNVKTSILIPPDSAAPEKQREQDGFAKTSATS